MPRTALPAGPAGRGLVTTGLDRILRVIATTARYHRRTLAEADEGHLQIVPYCVVRLPWDGSHLLTRRLRHSTEARLHDLCSLGIGGHVNPSDGGAPAAVAAGLAREWAEEVICPAPATARLVAALDDRRDAVSRVHLGLVFVVEPEAGPVTIRETDKLEGGFLRLDAMAGHREMMETWSQLVYDDLVAGTPGRAQGSPLTVRLPPTPGRDGG